uniref:Taste 1 receptor member 1 n=1 Tax=Anas platyrhynchos TaxID=8839 RepID=A0A8B9T1I5_ANAPL
MPPVLLCLGLCLSAATASFFSRDGDYRLAGLFQLHGLAPRAAARVLSPLCSRSAASFKSHGYHLLQTMRFALEEINNSSSLLPNVTLGYDIYDTCSESANLYATLRALVQKGQHYEPTALALTTAAILGVFLVPEVTSLETLSLKRLYPSFLRTIPSDGQQVKAIALLLQSFQWSWVALLGSDNAYGRDGLDALYELLVASGVNVTVIFSNVNSARPFFEVVVQNNITGMVWVASEDWSLAQNIWQLPGIQTIGSVIGMSVEQAESTMLEHLESWKYCRGTIHSALTLVLQLLQKIKQVNFSLHNSQICFDANGNIYKGYNIIMWNWRGLSWAFDVVGTFTVNPNRLLLNRSKILWHTKDHQAPISMCSQPCAAGEKRLQQNRHRCCFSCVACPAGTFLNRTDPYTCQACGADEWSPARSELCFNRTLEFLSWAEPLSWALLAPIAGGRLCFLMLGSLGCACGSLLCYFGAPSRPCCLLRLPLFAVGFAVFLSSVAARCLQLVAIFKLRGRCPRLRRACLRRRTPLLLVAAGAAGQAALCLAALLSAPPGPLRRRDVAAELLVLECGGGGAAEAAAEALNVALSGGCFALSYAGKDLPAAYREARCLTCGLLLHLACAAAALCTRGAFRGREAALAAVLGALCTLAPPLAGYFVPRGLALLLRPEQNTAAHFRGAIGGYARRGPAP